jgi:hypothetical protein
MPDFTVIPWDRGTLVRCANGDEYTFEHNGELRGVGFTNPDVLRSPAEWDAAYLRAAAWIATNRVPA